jgi:hypothetical protein
MPPNIFEGYDSQIPIYYLEGQKQIPSINEIENAIESTIKIALEEIDISSAFPNLEIKQENTISSVEINDATSINVKVPITIRKGTSSSTLNEEYSYSYDLRIRKMLEVAINITEETVKDPENINLENIFELQEKYDMDIGASMVSDDIVVYIITDEQSTIDNFPIKFYFAVKI